MRKREIYDREGRTIYLTRWWLLGSETSRWALMLHKMHRPDDDACHHDHPWSFLTLVLWGGYVEEVTERDRHGTWARTRNNHPGMLLYRRATHTHRIAALPRGYCYTLVLRMKKQRSWGFHTKLGWVPWREFIEKRRGAGKRWCD